MGDENQHLGDILLTFYIILHYDIYKAGGDKMIVSLSKYISNFLNEKKVVSEEDIPVYQYGFEIIISTILGFLIVLGIGILLNMKLLSMLYYIIFVFMRQLTGGYHADTYLKCNLIFGFLSFVTMGITKLAVNTRQYNLIFYLILMGISLAVIWVYSPIENKNKPLDEKQKKKNHILSCIYSCVLSVINCILFKYAVKISILLILTLFMISVLIIISKLLEGEKNNENC